MTNIRKILVATDTEDPTCPCVPRAVDMARHLGASLTLVDVIPEFSWTVRLTLKDSAHMHELIEKEKLDALDKLAAPIAAEGFNVSTEVLTGRGSVELIRKVQRDDTDLLICHAKSAENVTPAFFGETAMRLLRKCPCPTLLLDANCTADFKHVAGCVDTSTGTEIDAELNNDVFRIASEIAGFHNSRLSIVHAWAFWNEQMLKGRIASDVYEAMEGKMEGQIAHLLDEFLKQHDRSVRDEAVHMLKGETSEVISEFAEREKVDLVVLGTVARSGLSGIIMGNTAERILGKLECSVLAIKPSGFHSHVH